MTHAPPLDYIFFFNDTATTEIYTLSLHDALPICRHSCRSTPRTWAGCFAIRPRRRRTITSAPDRKSTRLNSSHGYISYAVFCLKKKKNSVGMRGLHENHQYNCRQRG